MFFEGIMKVLVTGGAGFIGKYLVEDLIEKNNLVTIFDDFSNSSKKSISYLVSMGTKVIEGDITNPSEIFNAVKDQDIVIHLAAKISVKESIKNPSETFHVNVDGTKNVLTACFKNNIKNLIVASSASVYGESQSSEIKLSEDTEKKPVSPYGESKMKMEQEIKKFILKHKIKCTILRFFNIYGIGQSDEYAGVITKFLENISQDKPLVIYGNGEQTRDFVSIHDVVEAFYCATQSNKNGTYNIASGKSISIKSLAKEISEICNKKDKITFEKEKQGRY